MRLHTNKLRASDVRDALVAEIKAGRIAWSVEFKELVEHGSRSHDTAIEVQLSALAKEPGDGRRVGNSGSYGAMSGEFAATYDEWGWLLAALYRLDPNMVCGAVKHPVYADAEMFHDRTGATYALGELLPLLEAGNDPYPYVHRDLAGRRGAGRSESDRWAGLKHCPRTADWYREFAKI